VPPLSRENTGSHRKFRHPTKKNRIAISYADGQEIPPGKAMRILEEAGL